MEIYLQKTGVSLLIIYGILIESGADVKNVQTRLGHTNIETTLQTYVHDTEKCLNVLLIYLKKSHK